jgi:hypothetical protein
VEDPGVKKGSSVFKSVNIGTSLLHSVFHFEREKKEEHYRKQQGKRIKKCAGESEVNSH